MRTENDVSQVSGFCLVAQDARFLLWPTCNIPLHLMLLLVDAMYIIVALMICHVELIAFLYGQHFMHAMWLPCMELTLATHCIAVEVINDVCPNCSGARMVNQWPPGSAVQAFQLAIS